MHLNFKHLNNELNLLRKSLKECIDDTNHR